MKLLCLVLAAFCFFAMKNYAASSEEIGGQSGRAAKCQQQLKDQIFIVHMHNADIEFASMRQKAINSHNSQGEYRLDDDHFLAVMKLIDEAEEAARHDALQGWINRSWEACMGKAV